MSRGWYGHYSDYARRQPSYHDRYNPVRDVVVGAAATVFDQSVAKPLRRLSTTFDKYMQSMPEIPEFVPEAERGPGQMVGHWNNWDTYSNWWHSPMWTGVADVAEVASHLYAPGVGQAVSIVREVLSQKPSLRSSDIGDKFSFSGGGSLPSAPSSSEARLSRSSVFSRYNMSFKRRPIKKRAYGSRTKQTRFGRYPASAMRSVNRSNGSEVIESKLDSRWEKIPKQIPSSLKYFDTVSGTGGAPYGMSGQAVFQLGTSVGWDPLGIAEYGVAPVNYASARGAGSSRRGPKIVIVAIEIQVYFVNIAPIIDTAVVNDALYGSSLAESSYKIDFYHDRQCNGAQFTAANVFETIDTKTTNTLYPNDENLMQTFPSIENDGRFDMIGRVASPVLLLDQQGYFAQTATTLTFAPFREVLASIVLKGPFEIAYTPRNNLSTGNGSIDQRKSSNINGLYTANYDIVALQALSNYTTSQDPQLWVGSRTIFYDSD